MPHGDHLHASDLVGGYAVFAHHRETVAARVAEMMSAGVHADEIAPTLIAEGLARPVLPSTGGHWSSPQEMT